MKTKHGILAYHAFAYLLLLLVLGTLSESVLFEGNLAQLTRILLALVVVSLGQAVVAFRRELNEEFLFAFFLSDAAATMILVRSTGGSASPFLVLFPMIALAGVVVFRSVLSLTLLLACLGFQIFSIGFGPSIVGNMVATALTALLGMYLVKALDRSGIALRISEGARKRLENLQKAILANIPSGLMSIDSTGRIIQINRVGLRILGHNENEVLFSPLKSLLPGVDEQIYRLNTLVPGLSSFEASPDRPTVRFRRTDGEELQLGYSVTRLSDPEDMSTLGSLVVFQDLTEIVKLEESLRMSEKLAAVGKLAAGIAHEIRNPLAGISGSAQLLTGSEHMSDEDKKLLAIIQRESTRLDGLITEFLEYVREPKLRIEDVALTEVAQHVVESLQVNPKWNSEGCRIELVAESVQNLKVKGDSNKITQALINLVLNSGQARARRVEIRIGPEARIEVRDDGEGISPENQRRLFEPFFTTKEAGTGLGLATSYRALEAMDARITVISPLPDFCDRGGTMFSIQFKGPSKS